MQENRRRQKEEEELRKQRDRAKKMAEFEKWKNPPKANFVISKRATTEDGVINSVESILLQTDTNTSIAIRSVHSLYFWKLIFWSTDLLPQTREFRKCYVLSANNLFIKSLLFIGILPYDSGLVTLHL